MANIRKENKIKKETTNNGRNRQDIKGLVNKLTKEREKNGVYNNEIRKLFGSYYSSSC